MLLLGVRSLIQPALIRVKQGVVGWAIIFASASALLCRFVVRLFIGLLVQHDSRWRHVSFWWDVHRLQVGSIPCLTMCFLVVP